MTTNPGGLSIMEQTRRAILRNRCTIYEKTQQKFGKLFSTYESGIVFSSLLLFLQVIKKFRDEELEHLETGLEHDAEKVT